MTAANLTTTDFLAAIQALRPRGRAWPTDASAQSTPVWAAVADLLAAQHARASALSEVESDPGQTIELLAEWERAFGLPDPCTPLNPTLQQRRAALLARIAALGGQSPAYLVNVAAQLGYSITITEYRPFRAGLSGCGTPITGPSDWFRWTVNAPAVTWR